MHHRNGIVVEQFFEFFAKNGKIGGLYLGYPLAVKNIGNAALRQRHFVVRRVVVQPQLECRVQGLLTEYADTADALSTLAHKRKCFVKCHRPSPIPTAR